MKNLSHSEMAMWRRCRRKWYLSQHRGLRRVGVSFNDAFGIGNRVHDALSSYYDPEKRLDPVQFVRGTVAADLVKYPEHEDTINKEAAQAELMISGYLDWLSETGIDQGLEVIESEKAVVVDLIPGTRVISKLDVRVEHAELGGRYALEFKTTSTIKPPAHLSINTQFLTEHLAEYLWLLQNERDPESGAKGVIRRALLKSKRTARAKGPFFASETVRHNVTQLRNHWYHVVAIAEEINTATEALDAGASHHTICHPNPTDQCSWDCPFVRQCQNMDSDPDNAERAFQTQFEVGDPLERYQGLLNDR